jgi:helix-turn-helix protein
MGTLADTAIVDYHLPFANPGKQTSVFRFRLQQNKRKFVVSVYRKQTEDATFCLLDSSNVKTSNGKRKQCFPFSFFRLLIVKTVVCFLCVC